MLVFFFFCARTNDVASINDRAHVSFLIATNLYSNRSCTNEQHTSSTHTLLNENRSTSGRRNNKRSTHPKQMLIANLMFTLKPNELTGWVFHKIPVNHIASHRKIRMELDFFFFLIDFCFSINFSLAIHDFICSALIPFSQLICLLYSLINDLRTMNEKH